MGQNLERRDGPRQMCSELVRISFQDPGGQWVSETGVLEDVSPSGLGVSLNIPVSVGDSVRVLTEGFFGSAKVCHCRFEQYSYSLGLEFSDGYTWDRNDWEPPHLLAIPVRDTR